MAGKKHFGQCRLCKNTGELIRSHIVPELAYQPMKNQKGQMFAVGRKTRKKQVGYREPLLCKGCDGHLSVWETEFKRAWMDTIPRDFSAYRIRPLRDPIIVRLPDYGRFKLFHLSVLWRAAVSSGFKIDARISLGEKNEEEIRQMLLKGDPGNPGDFPIFGTLNLDDEKSPIPGVSQLAQGAGRFEGHHYYLMNYAYCDWTFIIARPGPQWMTDLETKYRRGRIFLLLPMPFEKSKSFNLSVDILRTLRT